MTVVQRLAILFTALMSLVMSVSVQATEAGDVYELRVYTTPPGKLPALLARFKNHTCALFERHGMKNVGYWLPLIEQGIGKEPGNEKEQVNGEKDKADKLYYLLQHKSRAAAEASWKAFGEDPEWIKVRSESEAEGAIVQHVDSIFLASADYSPNKIAVKGKGHVFELRTYTTNPEKLSVLDTRFRNHTMALFAKHGMTNVGYWHPTDADKGESNTLIYLLAHKTRETAKQSWAAFGADPDWIKVRTESESTGPLMIEGGVKSVFLVPTDFSALK